MTLARTAVSARVRGASLALTAACLLAVPAGASAATATTPSAPPPPVPVIPSAAGGKVSLTLLRAGGNPLFAIAGKRIAVHGLVTPYVGGQTVKVSVYREGAKVSVQTLPIVAIGNGQGQFQASYTSGAPGLVQIRVAHYATPLQAAFTGRAKAVRYVQTNLGPGSSGESVRLLQSELAALHYETPVNGVFDEATGRALVAFRKVTGMSRITYAGRSVFATLYHHGGAYRVHFPRDGRHVEGDLTKQVLVEIEAGGKVHRILTMSSGKPSTPTVIGHFSVYSKTFGVNEKGMVDSNYFIRGYAIHGYPEVPTYAASHGCLRIPIPNAASVYGWVQYGTAVDVFDESGNGSTKVRGNAGP